MKKIVFYMLLFLISITTMNCVPTIFDLPYKEGLVVNKKTNAGRVRELAKHSDNIFEFINSAYDTTTHVDRLKKNGSYVTVNRYYWNRKSKPIYFDHSFFSLYCIEHGGEIYLFDRIGNITKDYLFSCEINDQIDSMFRVYVEWVRPERKYEAKLSYSDSKGFYEYFDQYNEYSYASEDSVYLDPSPTSKTSDYTRILMRVRLTNDDKEPKSIDFNKMEIVVGRNKYDIEVAKNSDETITWTTYSIYANFGDAKKSIVKLNPGQTFTGTVWLTVYGLHEFSNIESFKLSEKSFSNFALKSNYPIRKRFIETNENGYMIGF